MSKYADRYFEVNPWNVIENGFNPEYSEVSESVFSLGNEHMGLRGYFDEGYSGKSLQGSYVNGVYERIITEKSGYKGIPDTLEFLINSADWVYTRISCKGETLDLAVSKISDFTRVLNMKTGELKRSFMWHVDGETVISLTFSRFLSMKYTEIGASKLEWEFIRGKSELNVSAGLDFTRKHMNAGEDGVNFWTGISEAGTHFCYSEAETKSTKQKLYASILFSKEGEAQVTEPLKPCVNFTFNENGSFYRLVCISKTKNTDVFEMLSKHTYESLFAQNCEWWQNQWENSDIVIEGNIDDQQGIRYCVFQMHQIVHSGKESVAIGAKGLTGEAYNGNTFWDTETYCLPFYLFSNPGAVNSILRFRLETLPQAMERAKQLDCEGAFYPIATISGTECCTLWQHANTQLQPSTAVAYGIWHYARVTGDENYLKTQGVKMLVEICRMLATRGGYDQATGNYGYYGVMGPDEFQLMVNHNMYTNYMAKKTFEFTVETVKKLNDSQLAQLNLKKGELEGWQEKAEKMYVKFDEDTLLYEQHAGYFSLPHVDVNSIPVEDFPLYANWSYDRIYRNDMIKQPDVLMFMCLYPSDFTYEQIAANYDYYEPRCIHESSLSPSVHSILASRLGRDDKAYEFFKFASRMDLDNYNRNTREGLHMPSIAGSWMNIVYGFAGLRSDEDILSLSPRLPETWENLSFRLLHRGVSLDVFISRSEIFLRASGDNEIRVKIYGNVIIPDEKGVRVPYGCLEGYKRGL